MSYTVEQLQAERDAFKAHLAAVRKVLGVPPHSSKSAASYAQELQARVAELEGERAACHELLDEFFEHPKDPAESVDSKLGRLIKDAILVLKERDILIRGVRAAMLCNPNLAEIESVEAQDQARIALREALAIACTEAAQTVE